MIYPLSITYHEEPELQFEVVERKGIGHPDSLADAIGEEASRQYSQYMKNTFGGYAHHWFDKVMLLGGESDVSYGKGDVIVPFIVIFAGKVVRKVGSVSIPLDEILFSAAAHVLESTLDGFEAKKHLKIENRLWDARGPGQRPSRYRPNSSSDLITKKSLSGISNDCNVCCGYAPLSTLEAMVLETERFFTDRPHRYKDTGTDVKIVGTKRNSHYHLLVNLPFLASHIHNWEQYLSRVTECENALKIHLKDLFSISVDLTVNPEKENERPYLTATGTVADTGDIGAIGRGNRINGLITPFRPMSIEASNGKNPLDHTGKIYGVLAHRLALKIYDVCKKPVEICLTSSKERPVDRPDGIFIKFRTHEPVDQALVEKVIEKEIQAIGDLVEEFINPGIVQF